MSEVGFFEMKRFFPSYSDSVNGHYVVGDTEKHFGVTWRIMATKNPSGTFFRLECQKAKQAHDWSIDTEIERTIVQDDGETLLKAFEHKFSAGNENAQLLHVFYGAPMPESVRKLNLNIVNTVRIKKMEGIQIFMRHFDDRNEPFSDVVLEVQGEKFYVLKKHLASNSAFFNRMFFGEFKEAYQSEVKLEKVDPYHIQKFLELINGEPVVNDDNVEEILSLADYLESPPAIRNCEEFLLKLSEKPVKMKFQAAIKHKMERLKKKCYGEMATGFDVRSVVPEDDSDFSTKDYADLIRNAKFLN